MAIRKQLQLILDTERNELVRYVVESILNINTEDDEIQNYVKDVLQYGCVSGIVGELIYYNDTHAFYDRFYDEIEDLRLEYLQQGFNILDLIGNSDLKNKMAWIAYEETIRQIADELGFTV
jgi:hypothetical protein